MRRKPAGVQTSPSADRTSGLPDPIDLIRQDHERQLEICSGLERLVTSSETEPVTDRARRLLSFLTRELPLHVKDEELELFPKLKARRQPDSNLHEVLEQLVAEHETDYGLADLIVADLRAIIEGKPPAQPARFQWNVGAFCEMQRRHLNWENRVVLPLAETLLTVSDKQDLAQRMIDRRNAGKQT